MRSRLTRRGLFLIAALPLAATGCGIAGRAIEERRAGEAREQRLSETPVRRASGCGTTRVDILGCDERLWADSAWRYIESNTQETTGVVNSTDGRPVVTMWDVADAIAALHAARELGIIDTCTFDERFGRIVAFLNTMPLVDNIAPNRWYNATNATMVNADNNAAVVGWSAIDLGRLLVWLRIVEARHPFWSEYIGRAIARWNFCAIVESCGTLNRGIHRGQNRNDLEQEGRLGYEEYAAAGFALWGFDVRRALEIDPAEPLNVEGVSLLRDRRDIQSSGSMGPLTTTPFAAWEMELGGTAPHADSRRYRDLGRGVAEAQYTRFRRDRTMTARTHRPLATPPWLVYDSVWAEGYSWNAVEPNGRSAPHFMLLSTAAVFELWAAYPDAVADHLLEFTCSLRTPRGWQAGRVERTGGTDRTLSLRTNAAVLESILYRTLGVIYRPSSEPSWLEVRMRDEFFRPGRCLPSEERWCDDECPPFRRSFAPQEGALPPQ